MSGRNVGNGTGLVVKPEVEAAAQMFEQHRPQLALALPEKVNQDRFILGMRMAVQKNPRLLECDRESLMNAGIQAAELGLYVGGAIPHAHLVPFKDKDRGGIQFVQLIPDYRGLIYLAVKCGAILKAQASLVYKGDSFVDVRGSNPELIHKRTYQTEGVENVIAGYLMVWLPNGERHWSVLTRARLFAVKERALKRNSGGFSPWNSDTEEMFLKTLVKYGLKTVPIGDDMPEARKLTRAISHDNDIERVDPTDPDALPEQDEPEEMDPLEQLIRLACEIAGADPIKVNQSIATHEGRLGELAEKTQAVLAERSPKAWAEAKARIENGHGEISASAPAADLFS